MVFDWILFDLDGTLWDHERASSQAVSLLCRRYGMADEVFLPIFRSANDSVWQELIAGEIDFEELRVRRFEMIIEEMGRAAPSHDPGELSRFYLEKYLEKPSWLVRAHEVVRTAAALAPIAILTNAPHVTQDVKLSHLGEEAALFQAMICADDVEELKPSRAFFDRASSILGIRPVDRVLMIGDSWEADLAAPREMGWATAWISHSRPTPAKGSSTLIFNDLRELERYLLGSMKSSDSKRV